MRFLLTDTYDGEVAICIVEAESINAIKPLIVSYMGRELTGSDDTGFDPMERELTGSDDTGFDPDDPNLDADEYGYRGADWDINVYNDDNEIYAWVEDHSWYVEALDKIQVKTVEDLMAQSRG